MGTSNYTAYVATINFILGAGVLGIPVAFVHAGLVTAVALLVVISTLSAAAMVWEVETISRAEWLLDRRGGVEAGEATRLVPARVIRGPGGQPLRPDYYLTPGRLDLIAVSGLFLGEPGRYIYMVAQAVYTFVSMWFYTVVVAVSLTTTVPIPGLEANGEPTTECRLSKGIQAAPDACQHAYRIFAAVYAAAMFLSMANDAIIRRLQIALSVFADLCMLLMVTTALLTLVDRSSGKATYAEITDTPFYFNPSGFGLAFSAFIFAQLAMHGVPVLLEYMKEPKAAKWIFSAALGTSMLMYAVLGVICAVFFASDVDSVITLNWRYYTHVDGGSALSLAISYIVRVFPVVTISAAFPLNAVALGKALELRTTDEDFQSWGVAPQHRAMACRFLVSIPSVVCANLMSKITTLMSFAGVLAFLLGFIIPATLQIASIAAVRTHWEKVELAEVDTSDSSTSSSSLEAGEARSLKKARTSIAGGPADSKGTTPVREKATDPSWTPYSWPLSHRPLAIFTLGFAAIAIPYSLAVAFQE